MPLSAPPVKSRLVVGSPIETCSRLRSGVNCAVMPRARGSEISITVKPLPGEGIRDMLKRLAAVLQELEATVVHLMVFGSIHASPAAAEEMRRVFGDIDWPMTWMEGLACDDSPIAGLQALAFAGGEVQRLYQGRRVVGSVWEDGAIRHCLLGDLGPNSISASRADQVKQTLDGLDAALAQGGFAFAEVIRTWFFLDEMLDWYGTFNQVRTQTYAGIRFRTGSPPASTGIGGRNPAGAALAASARAAQSLDGALQAKEIASPLQCPAPAYGSSFSRAMELSSPAGRCLFISGTASIAPDGRTLWQEDARKQVAQTMRVVEAILQSRGLSLSDLTRATAYFKHRTDAPIFRDWCAAHDRSSMPVVFANSDVCRHDLLFEIEMDAWSGSPGK